jgi:hypothetical protein
MTINLDIVNDVTYKQAKFQYEIRYIMGYTKMTNYIICHFCVAQNIIYLNMNFCMFVR